MGGPLRSLPRFLLKTVQFENIWPFRGEKLKWEG